MNRITVVLGVLALSWVVGPTARAVDNSPSAVEAKEHAQRAFSAFGLHKFDDAAREYEAAFALKPDPALLFNAAQANRYANKKPRAIELYESYVRLFPKMRNIDEVHSIIEKLKAAVAEDEKAAAAPPKELKTAESGDTTEPNAAKPTTTTPPPVETKPVLTTTQSSSNTLVASSPHAEKKPIYKKGWFWGAVAGGVVLVGGAVVLGVVLGSPAGTLSPSAGTVRGN